MQSLLINPASGAIQESTLDDNVILNGDFEINQSGITTFNFLSNLNSYTFDQWLGARSTSGGAGAFDIIPSTDTPSVSEVGGFTGRSIRFRTTTAQTTLGAGDFFLIEQRIEGYRFRSLVGKPFTLSFWVKASRPGVYCFSVRRSSFDLSYVTEYRINQAEVWEKKVITIPAAPTSSGTWNFETGIGIVLDWTMATGSNFRTNILNSWVSGNFLTSQNFVNVLDTVNNTFRLALVKLEPGIVASPFKHLGFDAHLLACRRYYTRMSLSFYTYTSIAGSAVHTPLFLPTQMRVTPSAALVTAGSRTNLSTSSPPTPGLYNPCEGFFYVSSAAVGWYGVFNEIWEFNARL